MQILWCSLRLLSSSFKLVIHSPFGNVSVYTKHRHGVPLFSFFTNYKGCPSHALQLLESKGHERTLLVKLYKLIQPCRSTLKHSTSCLFGLLGCPLPALALVPFGRPPFVALYLGNGKTYKHATSTEKGRLASISIFCGISLFRYTVQEAVRGSPNIHDSHTNVWSR